MTPVTQWLGRVAVVALIASCVLLGSWLFVGSGAVGRRRWLAWESALDAKLRFLRSPLRARQVLWGQSLATVALTLTALVSRSPLPLLGAVAALALPSLRVERALADRATRVEAQIEPWLNAVANALRASPSLGEAIASSAALVPAPMSQEIDVLVKESELGTPLDQALDNLAARVPSKTLAGTTLALKVARRSGGNLPEMLESAAVALRELARLEGVVRTKTAEGKAQTVVIGVIPVPLVGLVRYSDPTFFNPLVSSFTGNLVIGVAVVLWLVAVLLARKILQVDV